MKRMTMAKAVEHLKEAAAIGRIAPVDVEPLMIVLTMLEAAQIEAKVAASEGTAP